MINVNEKMITVFDNHYSKSIVRATLLFPGLIRAAEYLDDRGESCKKFSKLINHILENKIVGAVKYEKAHRDQIMNSIFSLPNDIFYDTKADIDRIDAMYDIYVRSVASIVRPRYNVTIKITNNKKEKVVKKTNLNPYELRILIKTRYEKSTKKDFDKFNPYSGRNVVRQLKNKDIITKPFNLYWITSSRKYYIDVTISDYVAED